MAVVTGDGEHAVGVPRPFAVETVGFTVVRRLPSESEWIDITPWGSPVPVLIEKWRGWQVELWGDWTWAPSDGPA